MGDFKENINNRTKKIEKKPIGTGNKALGSQQEALTQYQAIQSERRNNLLNQNLMNTANQQQFESAVQAANIGVSNGTMNTLSKYGLKTKPVVTKKSEIKMKPNNVVVNNNTTNIVNNSNGGDNNGNIGKFKAWLSRIVTVQKENQNKQKLEFEKQESILSKSANKMLSRIEAAGKDVVDTLNPNRLGTSIGNQMKILFFLFGVKFLGKYWDKIIPKVVDVATTVKNGFTNFGDYFGFTDSGKKQARLGHGFYNDLITFLGGEPGKKGKSTLFDIGKLWIKDLGDMLEEKIKHMMDLRASAIKNVKFPTVELGKINKGNLGEVDSQLGGVFSGMLTRLSGVLSSVSTYLGDILTALVDPSSAMHKSIKSNVNSTGYQSSMSHSKNYRHKSFSRNTDYGEADVSYINNSGKRNYSINKEYLTSTGTLKNNTAAQVGQSMDILGAVHDVKNTGHVDTARLAAGLQRLQDSVENKGVVYVDPEFVSTFYNKNSLRYLISSGNIKSKKYKYIRVKRTNAEKNIEEGAQGMLGGAAAAYGARQLGQGINKYTGLGGNMISSGLAGNGFITDALAQGSGWLDKIPLIGGLLGGAGTLATTISGSIGGGINSLVTNDYKLKLVPIDDPRSAVINEKTGKPFIIDLFSLDKTALNKLSSSNFGVNKFDSGMEAALMGASNFLKRIGGGSAATLKKFKNSGLDDDYESLDINKAFTELREFENTSKAFDAQENSTWINSAPGKTVNNLNRVTNSLIDFLNSGIENITDYVETAKILYSSNDGGWKDARLYTGNGTISVNRNSGLTFNVKTASNTAIFLVDKNIVKDRPKSATTSIGLCAKYVRISIMSGLGLSESRLISTYGIYPKSASGYINYLGKLGFTPLNWNGYSPEVGDILVCAPIPGHPDGHISIRTQAGWISDFAQKDMWGGSDYRKNKVATLFRHTNRIFNSVSGTTDFTDNYRSDEEFTAVLLNNSGDVVGYQTNSGLVKDTNGNVTDLNINDYNKVDYNSYSNLQNWNGSNISNYLVGKNATRVAQPIMGYLMKNLGITQKQAAGIVGNLFAESSLGTSNRIDIARRDSNGLLSAGLAQWNGQRFTNLQNYARGKGKSWGDLMTQLEFLVYELNGSHNNVLRKLKTANTSEEASKIFSQEYEKFKGSSNELNSELIKRQNISKTFAQNYTYEGSLYNIFGEGNESSNKALEVIKSSRLTGGIKDKSILILGDRWIKTIIDQGNNNSLYTKLIKNGASKCIGVGYSEPTIGKLKAFLINSLSKKPDLIIVHVGFDFKDESSEKIRYYFQILQGVSSSIPVFFCTTNNLSDSDDIEKKKISIVNNSLSSLGVNILDIRNSSIKLKRDGSLDINMFANILVNKLLEGSKSYKSDAALSGMIGSSEINKEEFKLKNNYLKIPYLNELSPEEKEKINSEGIASKLYQDNINLNNDLNKTSDGFNNFSKWFSKLSTDQRKSFQLEKEAEILWQSIDEKYRHFDFLPKGIESLENLFINLDNSERNNLIGKINQIVNYRKNRDKTYLKNSDNLTDRDIEALNLENYVNRNYRTYAKDPNAKKFLDIFNENFVSYDKKSELLNAIRSHDFDKAASLISYYQFKNNKDGSFSKMFNNAFGSLKSNILANSEFNISKSKIQEEESLIENLGKYFNTNGQITKGYGTSLYELIKEKYGNNLTKSEIEKLMDKESELIKNRVELSKQKIKEQRFIQSHLTDDFISTNSVFNSDLENLDVLARNKKILEINKKLAPLEYYFDPSGSGKYFRGANGEKLGMNQSFIDMIYAKNSSGELDNFYKENYLFTPEAVENYWSTEADKIRKQVFNLNMQKAMEINKHDLNRKQLRNWYVKNMNTANITPEKYSATIDDYIRNNKNEFRGIKVDNNGNISGSSIDLKIARRIAADKLIKQGVLGYEGVLYQEKLLQRDHKGNYLIGEGDLSNPNADVYLKDGEVMVKDKKASELSYNEILDSLSRDSLLGRGSYMTGEELYNLNSYKDLKKPSRDNLSEDEYAQLVSDFNTKTNEYQSLIEKYNGGGEDLSKSVEKILLNKIINDELEKQRVNGVNKVTGKSIRLGSGGGSAWAERYIEAHGIINPEEQAEIRSRFSNLTPGQSVFEATSTLPNGGTITTVYDRLTGEPLHTFVPDEVKLKRDKEFDKKMRAISIKTGIDQKKLRKENRDHNIALIKAQDKLTSLSEAGANSSLVIAAELTQANSYLSGIAEKINPEVTNKNYISSDIEGKNNNPLDDENLNNIFKGRL